MTSRRRLLVERIVPVTLFAIASLNFGSYRVAGDGTLYFAFVQHLFHDPPIAIPTAYGFGVGLLSVPFYAAGRIAQSLGLGGAHGAMFPVAAMTVGSIAYVAMAWVLSSSLLRRLRLPHAEGSTALAILGSPVWYYGCFEPMHAHPPDAALFALIALWTLDLWQESSMKRAILVGAAIAVAMTVRPFNLALLVGLCVSLAVYGRVRDAVIAASGAVATFAALVAIPVLVHAKFSGVSVVSELGFYPLSPVWMLFTDHRGLFIWTPLTLLSVIGVAIGVKRGVADGYLVVLSSMAAVLLAFYMGFKVWDGGWSFSARFLASPVALYAIGVSLLFSRFQGNAKRAVAAVAVLATVWSVFLGMNHAFGFADQPDGAMAIVRPYVSGARSPGDFAQRLWAYSRIRHVVERLHS